MSYRVFLKVPRNPNKTDICLCELRYTFKRKFILFGRRFLDISIHLGDHTTIPPIARKEDADLTAQIVYLTMRRLGAEVEVQEDPARPIRPGSDDVIAKKLNKNEDKND